MTAILNHALHGLDWLFSSRSPDLAQLFVGLIIWSVACSVAVLVIETVRVRRVRHAKR